MLSREDNEILTRTGAGTPMGALIRRTWIPALLASEVAEPNGAPVRVRLLGEDLIAFRATDGRVGLLDERCPHRRTSLVLAANEENGLRCIYHGWKFNPDGACVDMPVEPAGSPLKNRMKTKAYKTREAGGVIWAYMGPAADEPAFPAYEWLNMATGHSAPFKIVEDCNYAQAFEGSIDSAHAGVLHRLSPWGATGVNVLEKDTAPQLEVEFTRYGLRYGAVRNEKDKAHTRITQVIMPFTSLIPPFAAFRPGGSADRRLANCFVPRDDVSTWHFQWFFDSIEPIDVAHRLEEGGVWLDENFRKKLNIDNQYGQDRVAMRERRGAFSGIKGIMTQDHAVCEAQGEILDRSEEHLGTSDAVVVAWRRQLLRAARALSGGQTPAELNPPVAWPTVKAQTVIHDQSVGWKAASPLATEMKPAGDLA